MAKPIVVFADRLRNWVRIEIVRVEISARGVLYGCPLFFLKFLKKVLDKLYDPSYNIHNKGKQKEEQEMTNKAKAMKEMIELLSKLSAHCVMQGRPSRYWVSKLNKEKENAVAMGIDKKEIASWVEAGKEQARNEEK